VPGGAVPPRRGGHVCGIPVVPQAVAASRRSRGVGGDPARRGTVARVRWRAPAVAARRPGQALPSMPWVALAWVGHGV